MGIVGGGVFVNGVVVVGGCDEGCDGGVVDCVTGYAAAVHVGGGGVVMFVVVVSVVVDVCVDVCIVSWW